MSVSAPRSQGTNRTVYTAMQKSVYEFLTNTSWTSKVYADQERIECSFIFNITEELSSSEFKATLQVQAKRPVFGTSYSTVMFNYLDKDIQITYSEFDKLEYNPSVRGSNLVSILAYYAYIVIGLDEDSFAMRGGTPTFKQAEKIVIDSQSDVTSGWKPYEGSSNKNRYWLQENILNSKYDPMRTASYKYHRLGLDKMSDKVSEGRDQVYQALLDIQKVYRNRPDPYMFFMKLFFDAKADEIVNIFSMAPPAERIRVYQLLAEVDMSNEVKYAKLKEETAAF